MTKRSLVDSAPIFGSNVSSSVRSTDDCVISRTGHMRALAREHDVKYRCDRRSPPSQRRVRGEAYYAKRYLLLHTQGQDIEDEETYFVALHELAHVVLDHNPRGPFAWANRLEAEAEAWCWALEHALHPPSRWTAHTISDRLWGYYKRDDLSCFPEDHPMLIYHVHRYLPGLYFRRAGRLLQDESMASLYRSRLPRHWQRVLKKEQHEELSPVAGSAVV